jgi:protein TonB
MFNTLLESKRARQRGFGSTLTSAVFHIFVVVGSVYATSKVGEEIKKEKEEVNYVAPTPKEPPPPEQPKDAPPPPDMPNTPPPPKGFQTLSAPIEIPTVIPQIDLTARVTNELDFTGKGVQGGIAAGVVGGKGQETDQSFFQFEVEKVARLAPGNPEPDYPSILKQTQIEGKVMISFVIDTTGKADMGTFKVVESTNPLFSDAVKKILPKYNFIPAEIGSRKVRMHVNLPFDFVLKGRGGGQ